MCEDHVYVGRIQELGYSVCGKPNEPSRPLCRSLAGSPPQKNALAPQASLLALTCSDVFFSLRVLL